MNHEVLTFLTAFGRHRVPFLGERRRGGRAVECTGLENRQGCEPFVGSNPTLSAINLRLSYILISLYFWKWPLILLYQGLYQMSKDEVVVDELCGAQR